MTAFAPMAEIDLIPGDYRYTRALLRMARTIGIVCVALVCIAAALSVVLQSTAAGIRSDKLHLDSAALLVNQQRSSIAALMLRNEALASRVSLLRGLQRGAGLDELIQAVGRALPGDSIWFLEWRIERLGAIVTAAPAGAEALFVVERQPAAGAPPAVRVRMTIAGEARDRAAVSALVDRLRAEAGIEDVRVRSASRGQNEGFVKFDLLVVADSRSPTQ